MKGEMVYHADIHAAKTIIPVQQLQDGLYVLVVQTERGVFRQKLVIRH
jgi:hypothetical protein